MRAKQFWAHLPLTPKFNLVYSRISFSRITALYFLIATAHCAIQVIFQVQAFGINSNAAHLLSSIINLANYTQEFAILGQDLTLCAGLPDPANCKIIWGHVTQATTMPVITNNTVSDPAIPASDPTTPESDPATAPATDGSQPDTPFVTVTRTVFVPPAATATPTGSVAGRGLGLFKRFIALDPVFDSGDGSFQGINVTGLHNPRDPNDKFLVSTTCVQALEWPVQVLTNTKREDATFIAFQFWVFGMSLVALLNESIPHSIAALLTHVLVTCWSFFQLAQTTKFKADFNRVTTKGACAPNNLLPNYWKQRGDAEIPSAALNVVALFAIAFLTYKLIKLFGWQTFKRIGASFVINRVYQLVLALSISIQLSLFFIVAFMSLWLDKLYNGVAQFSEFVVGYRTIDIAIICTVIPWLAMGWYAVRRERRLMMNVFIVLAGLLIGGFGAMFAADTFRWTFDSWRFFAVMAVAAGTLTLLTFGLGIACRINFGKGLTRYLQFDNQPHDPNADFKFHGPSKGLGDFDVEKVGFPSPTGQIPSFSVAFGSGEEIPIPREMRFGPPPVQASRKLVRQTSKRSDNSVRTAATPSPAYGNSTASPTPPPLAPSPALVNSKQRSIGGRLRRQGSNPPVVAVRVSPDQGQAPTVAVRLSPSPVSAPQSAHVREGSETSLILPPGLKVPPAGNTVSLSSSVYTDGVNDVISFSSGSASLFYKSGSGEDSKTRRSSSGSERSLTSNGSPKGKRWPIE